MLQPWSMGKRTLFSRVFGKHTRKVWWIPLPTALDGDLQVSATVPNGADAEVALSLAILITAASTRDIEDHLRQSKRGPPRVKIYT